MPKEQTPWWPSDEYGVYVQAPHEDSQVEATPISETERVRSTRPDYTLLGLLLFSGSCGVAQFAIAAAAS